MADKPRNRLTIGPLLPVALRRQARAARIFNAWLDEMTAEHINGYPIAVPKQDATDE
jgi:hypothetical protein